MYLSICNYVIGEKHLKQLKSNAHLKKKNAYFSSFDTSERLIFVSLIL